MNNIKIFVIGSNSFSGASFIDFVLNRGFLVFGISRSPLPNNVFLPYSNNTQLKNYKFYQFDLNKDDFHKHYEKLLDSIDQTDTLIGYFSKKI